MDPHTSSTDDIDDMDDDLESACLTLADGIGQSRVKSFENWSVLSMVRELIDMGKPSFALKLILEIKRDEGGEAAVIQTLQRARELYRNKLHENAAADELASLFAKCAIAESDESPNHNQPQALLPHPPPVLMDDGSDPSILAMIGRKQIMLDAFFDGSSFICLKCGGLVSKNRQDEHLASWCGMQ